MSVDRLPLESLIAPAVVIDVAQASATNADYQVAVGDFSRFEQQHGADSQRLDRPAQDRVRQPVAGRGGLSRHRRTGRGRRSRSCTFPGLHPDAATLAGHATARVKAVGIDTASIDFGQSTLYETHRILNGRDIPAFENLAVARSAAADRVHS